MTSEEKFVMTMVGPDQPGIVDRLSGILTEKGYNLEDSRMAVLGGDFAIILLVSPPAGPGGSTDEVVSEIESNTGMTVTVRRTADKPAGKPGIPFLVHGYSMDHPGIVHALAHEVSSFGANIEEMETKTEPAPVSGTPLFDVRMRISLPADIPITDLRKRLLEVGAANNIDISIEPFVH